MLCMETVIKVRRLHFKDKLFRSAKDTLTLCINSNTYDSNRRYMPLRFCLSMCSFSNENSSGAYCTSLKMTRSE